MREFVYALAVMIMKVCVKCGHEFDDEHFYSNPFMAIGDIYLEITGTVKMTTSVLRVGKNWV